MNTSRGHLISVFQERMEEHTGLFCTLNSIVLYVTTEALYIYITKVTQGTALNNEPLQSNTLITNRPSPSFWFCFDKFTLTQLLKSIN